MSMMPADLVGAFAGVLSAISPSVGVIHQRRRSLQTTGDLNTVLMDASSGKLSGVFLSIEALPAAERLMGRPSQIRYLLTARLRLEFFRGFEDAADSETAFRDTVWRALDAINSAGRVYSESSHQEPATCRSLTYMLVACAVLLHYADCFVDVRGQMG
jgi:hypothetical protein